MATTTAKPQRSPEEIEDIILRKIFLVTLIDSMGNDTRVVYLEMTAAEILSEGGELRLSRDVMERVLVDRLSGNFTSAETPFQYLVGIYRRAYEEGKKITNMKDKSVRAQMELVVNQAKKLAVSYCRIHLGNPDMFTDPQRDKSNVSPLLPLIFSEVSSSIDTFGGGSSGGVSSPPGFLEEFFRDSDYDSMETILKQLYEDLRGTVLKCSALGNFQQPLRALMYLISFPVGARALVNHQWWIPKGVFMNGRAIEMTSILGPFFHISALPDQSFYKSQPDVGEQCFMDSSTRRPADLLSSFATIKTVMNNLYDGLAEVLRSLLKNTSTRENVLQYIAEVINKNASRAHIQVDPLTSASSGMFVNLSAVMLRLCEPFLDANSTKKDKIDPKYVFYGSRLDFKELTALHASSEEVTEWLNKNNPNSGENRLLHSQETTSSGQPSQREYTNYSFICECFFMTARVLNLGLLKAFSDFKHLVQDISRCEDSLSTLKTMQEQTPSPRVAQEIARLEKETETLTQEKLCYEAQILRLGNMNKCEENKCWEIIHIPDKPPFPPHQQPTVKVYAAVIDPKHANTLVRKLNKILPLENLHHVKRVRKQALDEGCIHLSVILCLAGESESQLDIIPQEVVELINSYKLESFITKVCKYAPLSKEEWIEQCKIWPTSYHPPTYNISGITGFSEEESHSVCTFMKQALDLAKCECQMMNAAIIVDPSSNQVIAHERDQVNSCSCSSINHEVTSQNHDKMLLNSSATKPKLLNHGHGVSCLNPWQWSNQNSCNGGSYSWHPLRHAAIVAIEHSAARDRRLFPGNEHAADNLAETNPSIKKQKTKSVHVKGDEEVVNSHSNGSRSELGRPYLCTGYDIYLVWEPCAMCAMALVHQRVKRIFYAFPNTSDGALGSVHRLQGEKSLNHHYAVFQVMLPQEYLDKYLT